MDAIKEVFLKLSKDDQTKIQEYYNNAASTHFSWSLRFTSAKLALRTLGATCITDSSKNTNSLWKMPCGCTYELDYARTTIFQTCEKHPIEKATLADIIGFIKNIFEYILVLVIWTSTIVAILAIFEFLTTKPKPDVINIYFMYLGLGIIAVILRRILYKRKIKDYFSFLK